MTEHGLWEVWFSNISTLIIFALVALNFLLAWFALAQKIRCSKLEHDIFTEKPLATSSLFTEKRSIQKPSQPEKSAHGDFSEDESLLKIDQAIKMLKCGASLEEIRSAVNIEPSYLQIIAKHHHE